ncbi:hypothetical protein RUM43_003090 [Polyplax serrata]|uniref:Uncharacterized protein n=1 Tax=Polyplax serrata TaxID=468196 RepID=A0AAN8RWS4_POLSC
MKRWRGSEKRKQFDKGGKGLRRGVRGDYEDDRSKKGTKKKKKKKKKIVDKSNEKTIKLSPTGADSMNRTFPSSAQHKTVFLFTTRKTC